MTITVTPPPPYASLPQTVTVCLSSDCLPGKIEVGIDNELPTELDFPVGDPCTKLYIPDGIAGMTLRNKDSKQVTLV